MKKSRIKIKHAQTAIEYMLLFALGAIIVFVAFRSLLPRMNELSDTYYNKVARGIMDGPPPHFPAVGYKANCNPDTYVETPKCQESSLCTVESNCRSYGRQAMRGRCHWGDENGDTVYNCCNAYAEDDGYTIRFNAEGSYFKDCERENNGRECNCPNKYPFLYMRLHAGDETEPTQHWCTSLVDMEGLHLCMNGPFNTCAYTGWVGESGGNYITCPPERPFLHGRQHLGDENGSTRYLCCDAMTYPDFPNCNFAPLRYPGSDILCEDRDRAQCCQDWDQPPDGEPDCSQNFVYQPERGSDPEYAGCIESPIPGECMHYEVSTICETRSQEQCCSDDECSNFYEMVIDPDTGSMSEVYLGCDFRPELAGCRVSE